MTNHTEKKNSEKKENKEEGEGYNFKIGWSGKT